MRDQSSFTTVRDAALVVFSFVFGLRDSSVIEVRTEDLKRITERELEVVVQKLKGRTVEEALRRGPRL